MSVFTAARSATRNIALDQLAAPLQDQSTRKLDVVAGAGAIRSVGGHLVLDGTEPQLGPDGVTMTAGSYQPNDVAVEGLAAKLNIPGAYLRRLADDHLVDPLWWGVGLELDVDESWDRVGQCDHRNLDLRERQQRPPPIAPRPMQSDRRDLRFHASTLGASRLGVVRTR